MAARRGIDPTQPDSARLVLVTGEPGIGKTRLLAELARRAHADGGTVLAGRSPEETVVPYQPFLEALRHWVVSTPVSVFTGAVREYAIELSRLMPELETRAPISRNIGITPKV